MTLTYKLNFSVAVEKDCRTPDGRQEGLTSSYLSGASGFVTEGMTVRLCILPAILPPYKPAARPLQITNLCWMRSLG